MVSVIVPVYNMQWSLSACIDSILSQSFKDFEVILVDDGSSDASGRICDDYAEKDSRVRVFHKANAGVSSARNVGLDNANGEWIAFVDSDDYIQENYLYYLVNSDLADLIIGSSIAINNDNPRTDTLLGSLKEGLYKTPSPIIQKYLSRTEFKVPWGKLFRRSLLSTLRFDVEMKVGEDVHFMLRFLNYATSIRVLENNMPNSSYVYISPLEPFERKYRMSVQDAILHTLKSNNAYETLGMKSKDFEIQLAQSGYELCVDDISVNGYLWYNNREIKKICFRRSRNLGVFQLVKTWISFNIINRIRFNGKS